MNTFPDLVPRIGMVSNCRYSTDVRVRRQAEALVSRGYAVDVICARRTGEPHVEEIGGVTVWHVGDARDKYRGDSPARFALAFGRFFLHAATTLTRLHRRQAYVAIQIFSLPEALVFSAFGLWLAGVPVVYDAGDLTIDLYETKFGSRGGALAAGALRIQERLSLSLTDLVITVHDEYRTRLKARGVPAEKLRVVMNLPDERIFHTAVPVRSRSDARSPTDQFTVVYHGSLVERYGVDLAVQAVASLRDRIPGLRLKIYGDGELRRRLLELVDRHELSDSVWLSPGAVPIEDLVPRLSEADIAIVPHRADPFTETILPNKLLEYLALSLPTVVTRTRTIMAHVPEEAVEYCAPNDVAALAGAIERVWNDPARRQALMTSAHAYSAAHRWADAASAYCAEIEALTARRGRQRRVVIRGGRANVKASKYSNEYLSG